MINGETLINNIKRHEFIISDWDGVIQDTDLYWMKKLIKEEDKYKKYFDFSKLKNENAEWDISKVWYRDKYYYDKWLRYDNIEVPNDIIDDFTKLYMDDFNFYFYCPFLTMARTLKILVNDNFIDRIVFLSSAPTKYETDPRKILLFQKFFEKNKKMELRVIDGKTPKSEYINKYYPNYTLFIDDRSDVIRDIIDNTDSKNKQYIMPLMGYNRELAEDMKYISKCNKNGTIISAYPNEII